MQGMIIIIIKSFIKEESAQNRTFSIPLRVRENENINK